MRSQRDSETLVLWDLDQTKYNMIREEGLWRSLEKAKMIKEDKLTQVKILREILKTN